MKVLKIMGWVVAGIAGLAALALGLGWAVLLLWNWLMPEIFGLPTITFWQAVGLTVLSHLLFKSPFGAGGGGGSKKKKAEEPQTTEQDRFARRVRAMVGAGAEGEASGGEAPSER